MAETKVKPAWLKNGPLVTAVLPEPPVVQKYRGVTEENVDERFAAALNDLALDGLARAGVNLVWLRFYNGFGLDFEKAEMERARTVIAAAHSRGIKAAAIVELGGLTTETLLQEESECQNWLQLNSDGQQPVVENAAFFRTRTCFNSEGFLRYMERVCGVAADFGADLIHFEDVAYNPEPDTCHCSICVASFREFLRQRFGAQDDRTHKAGLVRFGHTNFTHVRPPVFAAKSTRISAQAALSPHVQEWTQFKAQSLLHALSRLSRGVSKRNPECAVSADVLRYYSPGAENILDHGIRFEDLLTHVDVATGDLLDAAQNSEETLKVARLFGIAVPVNSRTLSVEPHTYPGLELGF